MSENEQLKRLRLLARSSIVGGDIQWILGEYDRLTQAAAPCAHADAETFVTGDCGAVEWCRVCGALRDDDGWRAPSGVDKRKG